MSDIRVIANTNTLAPAANGNWVGLAGDRLGDIFTADLRGLAARAALAGRLVVASDADQNDTVLGQTSFANTTPTFLLNVPSGSCAIPLFVQLTQAGTVAGDYIEVIVEADDIAAYSSGGTSETLYYFRNGAGFATSCAVYSGATATAGYGIPLLHTRLAEDVDPASADAAQRELIWRPEHPYILVGPAALKVFTYAASTGPTWLWSIGFLDIPAAWVTS